MMDTIGPISLPLRDWGTNNDKVPSLDFTTVNDFDQEKFLSVFFVISFLNNFLGLFQENKGMN